MHGLLYSSAQTNKQTNVLVQLMLLYMLLEESGRNGRKTNNLIQQFYED